MNEKFEFDPSTATPTDRLLEMVRLLQQERLNTRELVQHLFGIEPNDSGFLNKQRDVQRYFKMLEEKYKFDIKDDHSLSIPNRKYIAGMKGKEGLPPIEALALHAATRMLYHHAPNKTYHKALTRLLEFIPGSIRDTVQDSVSELKKRSSEDKVFEFAARAWFDRQQLEFIYKTNSETRKFLFDTYFIEINRSSHALYLIGFEHNHKQKIITIKASRIFKPQILESNYTIPDEFDIKTYLHGAIGVIGQANAELLEVKLRFSPEARSRLEEGGYSSTTTLEFHDDGYTTATVQSGTDKHGMPNEVLIWARQWSSLVEIESPPHVRERWLADARELIKRFGGGE